MKKFNLNYKEMIMPTIFLTLIGIITYIFPLVMRESSTINFYFRTAYLNNLAIFLICSIIFIVIFEFNSLKTTKGADLYYALPMTKRSLHMSFYIKGLLELLLSFTILYILGFLVTVFKSHSFEYIHYIPLYFLGLVGIVGFYSLISSIFLRANRTIDGIIFILLYLIVPYLIYASITKILNFESLFQSYPVVPISTLFSFYDAVIVKLITLDNSFEMYYVSIIFWNILNLSLGIIGLLYTKDIKSENINQVSNSWIGYKVLLPLTLITMINALGINFDNYVNFTFLTIAIAMGYVGYVIYQRTFKLKWYYFLIIILSVIVSTMI